MRLDVVQDAPTGSFQDRGPIARVVGGVAVVALDDGVQPPDANLPTVSDIAPPAAARHSTSRPWWMLLGVVAGMLAVVALILAGVTLLTAPPAATQVALDLTPQSELDRNWGTYMSEREWGTPREAVNGDGWGLTWRGAIGTQYRYSSDAIAGFTDATNQFRLGWAFWDGAEDHVTERFAGLTNPGGAAGEQITDDRVFDENGPTHAYDRLTYRYPPRTEWFSIDLETARYDSTSMTFVATVTNTTSDTRSLDVVFKAWLPPGGLVEPLDNGVLLHGTDSVVAVVGQPPSEWQISSDKGALDANLRADGLAGDQGGHIGALAYRLEIPAGAQSVIRLGASQAVVTDNFPLEAARDQATQAAMDRLDSSDAIISADAPNRARRSPTR